MADYYADNPGPEETPAPAKESAHAEQEQTTEEKPTALLPKSILAGQKFEVGDEVVLRITRMMDDQIEVEYSYGDEKKGDEETPPKEEPMGDPRMASMMD